MTQAGLLENLHRLDTMIVEEVAKKSRDTIRPRCRRTRRSGGALVAPRIASPGRRSTVVSVAANLAGTSVSDEREREVFFVIEIIQDLVICGVERL